MAHLEGVRASVRSVRASDYVVAFVWHSAAAAAAGLPASRPASQRTEIRRRKQTHAIWVKMRQHAARECTEPERRACARIFNGSLSQLRTAARFVAVNAVNTTHATHITSSRDRESPSMSRALRFVAVLSVGFQPFEAHNWFGVLAAAAADEYLNYTSLARCAMRRRRLIRSPCGERARPPSEYKCRRSDQYAPN